MTTITSLHSDLLISIAAYLTQVIDLIHLRSASKTIHQKLASTTPTVIRAKSRYATVSCTKNLKHACTDKQTFFIDRYAWTSRSARVIGTIKSGDVDAVKQLLGVEDDISKPILNGTQYLSSVIPNRALTAAGKSGSIDMITYITIVFPQVEKKHLYCGATLTGNLELLKRLPQPELTHVILGILNVAVETDHRDIVEWAVDKEPDALRWFITRSTYLDPTCSTAAAQYLSQRAGNYWPADFRDKTRAWFEKGMIEEINTIHARRNCHADVGTLECAMRNGRPDVVNLAISLFKEGCPEETKINAALYSGNMTMIKEYVPREKALNHCYNKGFDESALITAVLDHFKPVITPSLIQTMAGDHAKPHHLYPFAIRNPQATIEAVTLDSIHANPEVAWFIHNLKKRIDKV